MSDQQALPGGGFVESRRGRPAGPIVPVGSGEILQVTLEILSGDRIQFVDTIGRLAEELIGPLRVVGLQFLDALPEQGHPGAGRRSCRRGQRGAVLREIELARSGAGSTCSRTPWLVRGRYVSCRIVRRIVQGA